MEESGKCAAELKVVEAVLDTKYESLATLLKLSIASFDLAGYGLWHYWLTRIRLSRFDNLEIYRGNSKKILPPMLEQSEHRDRIGLIIWAR